jgi:hypothetical protein
MTVESTNTENSTIADGVTVVFLFTFQSLQDDWVFAYTQDITLIKVPREDITVELYPDQDNNHGGTVTFNTAPVAGDIVTLYRQTPQTQGVDYTEYDAFPAESSENALDKLTMIGQDRNALESDSFESPISIVNEQAASYPNNAEIRYYGHIGGGPLLQSEIPFQPGGSNGLWGVRTFLADGTLKAMLFGGSSGARGLLLLPDNPDIADLNAAATVQFVLDNAGGQGADALFETVSFTNTTNPPAFGTIKESFQQELYLGIDVQTFLTEPQGAAPDSVYGYRWRSRDDIGGEYLTWIINGNVYPPQMDEEVNPPPAQALVSREWVEANPVVPTDPFFESVSVNHLTDEPTFGAFTLTYATFIGLATYQMVRWSPSLPSIPNQAFQWDTTDELGDAYSFQMLAQGLIAPANEDPSPGMLISRLFADETYLALAGGEMVGDINMADNNLIGIDLLGIHSETLGEGAQLTYGNLPLLGTIPGLLVSAPAIENFSIQFDTTDAGGVAQPIFFVNGDITVPNGTATPSPATLMSRNAGDARYVTIIDADMGGNKISNLGAPTLNSDAATKLYVDNSGGGGGGGVWGAIVGDILTQTDLQAQFGNYLLKTGGTLTGGLSGPAFTVTGGPTQTWNAAGMQVGAFIATDVGIFRGTSVAIGDNFTTASAILTIGEGRTGSGSSYIDLVGDTTYSSYGLRIIRDAGANSTSHIFHRGTGVLELQTQDSGSFNVRIGSTSRLTVGTTGVNIQNNKLLGMSSPTNGTDGANKDYVDNRMSVGRTELNGTTNPTDANIDGLITGFSFNTTDDYLIIALAGASTAANLSITASAENTSLPETAAQVCNARIVSATEARVTVFNTNNTKVNNSVQVSVHIADAGA